MFEEIIAKIEEHPVYAAAMRQAVETGEELVLNYHSHGDPTSYCSSICARQASSVRLVDIGESLRELVHIRAVGQSEADCVPLMVAFGSELMAHYGLERAPVIYLDGEPLRDRP